MILTSLIHAIRTYFLVRRTERALAQLDDRMLSDIGLLRSDIKAVSVEAVR